MNFIGVFSASRPPGTRGMAPTVHHCYFQPAHEEFQPAHRLEPVERVHVGIQGIGRRTTVLGDGETGRVPGAGVPAIAPRGAFTI